MFRKSEGKISAEVHNFMAEFPPPRRPSNAPSVTMRFRRKSMGSYSLVKTRGGAATAEATDDEDEDTADLEVKSVWMGGGGRTSTASFVSVGSKDDDAVSYDYVACISDAVRQLLKSFGQMVDDIKMKTSGKTVTRIETPAVTLDPVLHEPIEAARSSGVLVLTNRQLTSVLPAIHEALDAGTLRILDLSANRMTTVQTVGRIDGLRSLFLNQNRLQSLPEEICCLSLLENLSASYNFLEKLPASTAQLASLRELRLSRNRLRAFPEVLLQLKALRILDLSKNQIADVPYGLGVMQVSNGSLQ